MREDVNSCLMWPDYNTVQSNSKKMAHYAAPDSL